jgi:menaquinone-9 beta-reductase
MPEVIDAVIVGGGPAGIVTALSLVAAEPHQAWRVVVLEKAHYPREKPCAGAVGGRGLRILERLGALPDVPSVPITTMSFRAPAGEEAAEVGDIGRVVRRIEFDHALAEIARSRGVRIVEGAKVDGVELANGRATLRAGGVTYDARVVVGADGVGSAVRKAMGLGAGTLRAQVLELDTEMVPSDRARNALHFDATDRGLTGYYWDFPTIVGGRELMCRGIYHLKLGEGDVDLPARLGAYLGKLGLDLASYKQKRYAERGLDFTEKLSSGPLMLVGEAAGIDPITGEGIAQAIEYGELAGAFVARVLQKRDLVERWTAVVHRSRLGVDLRLRRRLVHAFFGPHRPSMERLLLDPIALRCGGRHFGALRHDPTELARSMVRIGATWLGTFGAPPREVSPPPGSPASTKGTSTPS